MNIFSYKFLAFVVGRKLFVKTSSIPSRTNVSKDFGLELKENSWVNSVEMKYFGIKVDAEWLESKII